jgi:putative membrane protein
MVLDAALSFLHFTFAFVLAGALSAEAFVLRLPVTGQVARLLLRIDLFYAISAAGIILAGVARLAWGARGWEFYSEQPLFWAKMATFVVVGVLSVQPTLTYFRWTKAASTDAAFAAADVEVQSARRFVLLELHALALLVLFAALMARGIPG